MRGVIFISVAVMLSACAQRQTPRVKTTRALTAEESRVIDIARQALASNDAVWVHRAECLALVTDGRRLTKPLKRERESTCLPPPLKPLPKREGES